MTRRFAAVVFCALAVLTGHLVQGPGASAGSDARRQADLGAIEKFHQQDISATLSRDPVALTIYGPMTPFVSAKAGRQKSASKLSERATNAGRLALVPRC